jgi:signal transduction histidine kinase
LAHPTRWAKFASVKKSVVIAFLFIVTVPLILVSWLGWRSVTTEQARFHERLLELQKERLQEFSDNQDRWIESLQTSLVQYLENLQRESYSNWPQLQNQNRFAHQLFSVDPAGSLAWPSESVLPLTRNEINFKGLFDEGKINLSTATGEYETGGSLLHWTSWFEGPGQQWAFWTQDNGGPIHGMVIDRTAFMSEAIAQLPDGSAGSSSKTNTESFVLLNEAGDTLYQWGAKLDDSNQAPAIETTLPTPLNMWRIQLISPSSETPPWHEQPLVLTMAASIIGLSLITLIAAYYLYSETRREFQQARQRISFVNQVSHEFKTPLTNIQLYSELLEDSVEGGSDNKYLSIIREETRKLSRMILNVLTFARNQKAALQTHGRSIVPDKLIQEQVEIHRPGLDRRAISLKFDLAAGEAMNLDPEIFAQIFSNLLSNAEKYAPNSSVSIESLQSDQLLTVTVHDTGPGIASSKHNSVFEPFVRLEDRATEGVSGTGIGLSIARDLARLHGGDLILSPSAEGTRFILSIKELS